MASSFSKQSFNKAFTTVANSIYLMLMAGWLTLLCALPLTICLMTRVPIMYYPTYAGALALSAPAFAALFAIFRDQPTFNSRDAQLRIKLTEDHAKDPNFPPDWIAAPYVPSDRPTAIFKPFFRAYAKLFLRALAVGFSCCLAIFAFGYDLQLSQQFQWGAALVPVLLVAMAIFLQAYFVGLVIVVEYPKAKWWSVMKSAVLLSVRRWVALLIALVVMVGFFWGVMWSPILVLLLGTGMVFYIEYAAARWQAQILFAQMAAESGDKRIRDMYSVGADAKSSRRGRGGSSFWRGGTDVMQ
ncbi:hypothetical protein [Bifidobacterium avesanii]|uniref:DUF624 domain-containing protein n=1 Tax=Bifidobacterium avesanii TaxID=1798157 RepID=A0A7K3THI7_9BIFI|nr:hypothetical protein [Bifidobacterium avesanii]KAB8294648.1 hypothetical protein DSM100685_0441 [Bifidobacterium avesanii]NEG78154.1 hypothetical protein [Bifidobacterium avesanii]